MTTKTKLTRIGDAYGLMIEKEILERLRISPDAELELFVDGDCLIVGRPGAVKLHRVRDVAGPPRRPPPGPPRQREQKIRLPKKQPW